MIKITFTDLADRDLSTIFEYLYENAGKNTAIKYRNDFNNLYQRLTDFPDSGVLRQKLGEGVRMSIVEPFLVFYIHMQANKRVTILRIIHGRSNITKIF